MGPQIIQSNLPIETLPHAFQLDRQSRKYLALGKRSQSSPQTFRGITGTHTKPSPKTTIDGSPPTTDTFFPTKFH